MKIESNKLFKQVGKTAIVVAATLSALAAVTQSSYAEAPKAKFQAPGFYRTMLGDFELTVISDGTALRHVDEIMSKPEQVRETYARNGEELPTELSINTFVINTGSKLILVDTGAGELFGNASSGRLVANMRAAGYQPEQVDAILLTHIHGDHSGGLSIGGKRVFPNADVYVDKNDSDYWLSEEKANAAPMAKRTTFVQSRATVNPYVLANKLKPFTGAQQLFPGISSIPAYGHTPGHTAYLIESQGKKLLLWGDVIHAGDVQFKDPDVTIAYDFDSATAVKSRQYLFHLAASKGYLVGSAHISFPGLGHVTSTATGYEWVAAPYRIQGTY